MSQISLKKKSYLKISVGDGGENYEEIPGRTFRNEKYKVFN